MFKFRSMSVLLVVACGCFMLFSSIAFSQSVNDITVVKMSSADRAAVIRIKGESLKVIKTGDILFKGATVTDITENRIVINSTDSDVPETIIIKITDDGQTIERIRTMPEESGALYLPVTVLTEQERATLKNK